MPPVIFVISLPAISLPCAIACCTPLRTRSSRISTSSGIDDFLRDLDRDDVAGAVRDDRDFAAAGADLDRFFLELGLGLGHLLLHLLRLLHQLVQIHERQVMVTDLISPLKISSASWISGSSLKDSSASLGVDFGRLGFGGSFVRRRRPAATLPRG